MQPIIETIGKDYGLMTAWVVAFILIFCRYAIFAGILYYIFYVWKRTDWWIMKIQQKLPKSAQLRHEISYSVMTAAIFAAMAFGVYFLRQMGYGKLYFNINDYSITYYIGSVIFIILLHDTYFYWIHRIMHHPRLFRIFHLVHHQSNNPTPWTSFSFHPLEAVVEFGIIPILAFFVPIHFSALIFFTLWTTLFNTLGHTGYEFSPTNFTKHPFFKWINTPTHHNMHHQKSNCNYGLYFNFWDRIMNTNHPNYHQFFEEIKNRPQNEMHT